MYPGHQSVPKGGQTRKHILFPGNTVHPTILQQLELILSPCYRYHGYHEMNGDYSTQYWHVMAIRIIFVLSFYYVISTLRTILDWMVADEPWKVKVRRKKTIYFIKRLFKDKNEHRSGVKAG